MDAPLSNRFAFRVISLTIQQLEYWTQIKSHTLRIWEQRYGAFSPQRAERQQRLYHAIDVQRALCLALLTRQQSAVAALATLPLDELRAQTEPLLTIDQPLEHQIIGLLLGITTNDSSYFEERLRTCWQQTGGRITLLQVILPLLQRIQQAWGAGLETLNEWASTRTVLEQTIGYATNELPTSWRQDGVYLLFQAHPKPLQLLPRLAHYLLRSQGYSVVLAEPGDLTTGLEQALRLHQPRYVLAFMTGWPFFHQAQSYLDDLVRLCNNTYLLVTGDRVVGQDLQLPPEARLLNRLEDLF